MAHDGVDRDSRALRAWWAHRQGLIGPRPSDTTLGEVLSGIGWARSVGGATGYVTAFSRAGITRARVDEDLRAGLVQELPSARGCAYVLPAQQFRLGLTIGGPFSAGELRTAEKFLGYTSADARVLDGHVLAALSDGPADPARLRNLLGDKVTAFGDPGRKRGLTTSLPITLGRLQASGRIRRIPTGGRLDGQRYSYELWPDGPADVPEAPTKADLAALATVYFGWVGSASVEELCWFTGWSKGMARATAAELALVEFSDGRLGFEQARHEAEGFQAPLLPDIRLITNLDSHVLLRRNVGVLLDASAQPGPAAHLIGKAQGLSDLRYHAIVDRGELIGIWDFDPVEQQVLAAAVTCWDSQVLDAVRGAADGTADFVREELGDLRMMSLDSQKGRAKRLAPLRAAAEILA